MIITCLPYVCLSPFSLFVHPSFSIFPLISHPFSIPPHLFPSPSSVSRLFHYQGWPAPWRREWPSPQPWPRVASLTWLNGKTGGCSQWAQGASPRPASLPRSGKRSGGWRTTPTVTSVTARRRLVSLQVGNTHTHTHRRGQALHWAC